MRNLVIAAIGIGTLSICTPAAAEGVPFKAPAVGTVLEFDGGSSGQITMTIKKVDAGIIVQDQNGRENRNVSFAQTMSSSESASDDELQKTTSIFPLEVGKKVTSGHSGTGMRGVWTATDNIEVVAEEEVSVPAGAFKTLLIKTYMYNANWNGTNKCWYAPQLGYCAKRNWTDSSGNNATWELKAIKSP
jgi:hypothetical protein